ncbi:DUF2748 family protein [Orientia tsutsugamushi]|uniref:DUF2748 family protein n=1 Tax=Orientia tsutsugamushi TaxID=784 RepID=UPI003528DDD1
MSNLYHILHKLPAIEHEDMMVEYENLAQSLVQSGKLRVDAEPKINFVRLSEPSLNVNIAISNEELNDPKLQHHTKAMLVNIYKKIIEKDKVIHKVNQIVSVLQKKMAMQLAVEQDLLLKLARLFVQSAHPIVIHWLLLERVEVFISYSNQIGDVMDIATWKYAGQNSGMQSINGNNIAIYVSCGGNPFFFTQRYQEQSIYGDGWPAIARLQIIAAQELGHYADIYRDINANIVGRHSVNSSFTKAKPNVLHARRSDLSRCYKILQNLECIGLNSLITYEKSVKFYRKNKVKGIKLLWARLLSFFYKQKLYFMIKQEDFIFVKVYKNEQYPGLMLKAMILDMISNLEPKAEVYKRDDPDAEEAIACVEALARVPQQVIKWGHITTMSIMQDLYYIYYKQVIPSLIDRYQYITGKPYMRNLNYVSKTLKYRIKKLWPFFKKTSLPSREV